jgi:hypothetical protein
MTMTGLSELPVELLMAICSHLCAGRREEGHRDLSRLSRTCRHLRNTIQPLVFTAFVRHDNTRTQHVQFLRTLTLRPDLAQCVKYLSLGWAITADEPVAPSDLQVIDSLVAKLHLPAYPSNEFTHGSPNRLPAIELILLHTPNLAHLNIPFNNEWELLFLPHYLTFQQGNNGPTILPRLRTFQVGLCYSAGDNYELGLAGIMTICTAAPQLERLYTCNPGGSPNEVRWEYPLFSNLRGLEFDSVCSTQPDVLRGMVRMATRLEVFGLTWDPTAANYSWCEGRTAADAWDMLRMRRRTLREVRLYIFEVPEVREGDWDVGRLEWCSLADFERLELLKVGDYALEVLKRAWRRENKEASGIGGFLEDFLPRGIKEVTLWEPGNELVPAMRRLADKVAWGRYPALDKITASPPERMDAYYGDWKDQEIWLRSRAELQSAFGRSRAQFEVDTERASYGHRSPFHQLDPYQF